MLNLYKDLCRHRELILILVERNIKIRYKNSTLGFFWTLLGPLFLILIYTVFLHLMKFNTKLPSLVTGIIAWQFLAMCMGDSLYAIVGNSNLVTKASFPRIILPGSMVLANTVNLLLSMAVLMIYLLVERVSFGAVIFLPFIMLTQFALCLGMALIISTLNVFFRDTEHVLSVVMLAWFFLSPVVYGIEFVWESVVKLLGPATFLFFLNPMTGLLSAYRSVLMSVPAVAPKFMAISFGMAWLILVVGIVVFQKSQARFGDEL